MRLACWLCLLLVSITPSSAATLRGFGTVQETQLPDGQGTKFACDSPAHATLLIHKLAHDMALSATVPSHWTTVQIAGKAVRVLVRPGLGAYLVLARGSDAYCFTAPLAAGQSEDGLAAAFAAAALLIPGAQFYDVNYKYPVYLDKFTTAGIGTWYILGSPFGDDPPGLKDIVTPHFQYLKENDLAVHLTVNAPFSPSTQEMERIIHEYERPYHIARGHEWDTDIARLDPYDLIQPGNVFTGYSDYYTGLSFGGDKLQNYREWVYQDFLQQYVNDPLLVDWDEPHSEIGPRFYQYYYDYGPRIRAHFTHWLQTAQGYTLGSLGQAWYHNPKMFTRWEQVPVPYDYALFGFDKNSLLADRTWRLHTAELSPGVTAGYTHTDFNDSQWPSLQLPGGETGQLAIQAHKHFWYRGTIAVPAPYLAAHKGPLYLTDATLSSGGYSADHIWFNGRDLGGISGPPGSPTVGSKEITGLVHAGINHIAFSPVSDAFPGTFFLATKPMETYPYADSGLNSRYVDWITFISNCALEEEIRSLKTIRGTDPNRLIKVAAVEDKDLFNPAMAAYGCFTHNTGDEAFFYPWDKRLAYPYGYRADAESSGSMLDPTVWKRWFGWFTFSGLNSFDNFIDVESMMYSAATPLWKENYPYLHLANRYDMKKPEIGLLWSSQNNRLSPGGHSGTAFCWDLGRGDIQPLGYSYAYFDEPGLHRHLADGYKVLWDEGTYVMSRETVADIRHFVEQGGTYVALTETGRNTLTERDTWPIETLSGFHVKEVRPLGGFVSILNDQPLFTTLAGQNFENYGRSIDYSNFNYADKCTVLEAVAPNTQAIARYRDGTIAIGMRTLGKGRVIVLGSPFWRDSYDQAGVWHPSAAQEIFLQDLLTGLGVPPDVPSQLPTPVWRDRYVANNGTEEYLLLFNPGDTATQTVTADWNASFPITQIYDPKTGKPYPATITGSTAQVSVTLAPYETKILATQSPRPPSGTVADWYADISKTWQGTAPGRKMTRPDLPFYYADFSAGTGKVVDTATVTPNRLAALSSSPDEESGWDARLNSIAPVYAGVTVTPGQTVLYRRIVSVPESWKPGDFYRLRLKQFQTNFQGVVYLNGKQVATGQQVYDAQVGQMQNDGVDVSTAIRFPGPNVLVIATNADGFAGGADLWRQPVPTATVSLAGEWSVQATEDSGRIGGTLPGTLTGILATKTVMVPASWNKSHVFLRLGVSPGGLPGHIAVNDKVFFYETETPDYLDVTPWIKFGQPNTVLIESPEGMNYWTPGKITLKSGQLEQILRF